MLEDILAGKKSLFATGVHTELRAQENRQRRVGLVKGNIVGNDRVEEFLPEYAKTEFMAFRQWQNIRLQQQKRY